MKIVTLKPNVKRLETCKCYLLLQYYDFPLDIGFAVENEIIGVSKVTSQSGNTIFKISSKVIDGRRATVIDVTSRATGITYTISFYNPSVLATIEGKQILLPNSWDAFALEAKLKTGEIVGVTADNFNNYFSIEGEQQEW